MLGCPVADHQQTSPNSLGMSRMVVLMSNRSIENPITILPRRITLGKVLESTQLTMKARHEARRT